MYSAAKSVNLSKPNTWKVLDSTEIVAAGQATSGDTYGVSCHFADKDSRYLIMVTNTAASGSANVFVQAGDSVFATTKHPTVSLAAGKTAFIQVESGGFKFVNVTHKLRDEVADGNDSDKVFVICDSASVKVSLLHTVL